MKDMAPSHLYDDSSPCSLAVQDNHIQYYETAQPLANILVNRAVKSTLAFSERELGNTITPKQASMLGLLTGATHPDGDMKPSAFRIDLFSLTNGTYIAKRQDVSLDRRGIDGHLAFGTTRSTIRERASYTQKSAWREAKNSVPYLHQEVARNLAEV